LTEFLYSAEQFDSKIGQQYLRARYYDPATGRFNRLDPFFGNTSDPQSFHKYLYTHAEPINGIDPTGTTMMSATLGIMGSIGSFVSNIATIGTFLFVRGLIQTWMFSELINGATEIRNHLFKQSVFGQGGYNATEILTKLRDDVISKWNALGNDDNKLKKRNLIKKLYSLKEGTVGWDIHDLTFSEKSSWTMGLSGSVVEETLTFRGHVYPVAEVNYVLWGLLNRLAYNDGVSVYGYTATYSYAYAYRGILGGVVTMQQWGNYFLTSDISGNTVPRFETATGKLAWVYYGWQWAVDPSVSAPEHESVRNATPTEKKWSSSLKWSAGGAIRNSDTSTRILKGEVY
jgi:RHS repeat-associated protein